MRIKIFCAAISQAKVMIFNKGQVVDYGGTIEKYSPKVIKIDGTYYIRGLYEFRACRGESGLR